MLAFWKTKQINRDRIWTEPTNKQKKKKPKTNGKKFLFKKNFFCKRLVSILNITPKTLKTKFFGLNIGRQPKPIFILK